MATNIQQTGGTARMSRGWSNLAQAIRDIGRGLSRGFISLGEQRLGAMPSHWPADAYVAPSPSDLFTQALREDSNVAMDWLWLFTQVSSAAERRYCLDRALEIDPYSEMARSERAKLPRTSIL